MKITIIVRPLIYFNFPAPAIPTFAFIPVITVYEPDEDAPTLAALTLVLHRDRWDRT